MKELPTLTRQWTELRLLATRHYGVSIRELADELGVTQRTIRRDLDVFHAAGFPLDETTHERGRKTWRLKAPADAAQLAFNLDEALALYLGRRLLEPLAGTVVGDAATSAFRKIRACLPKSALNYLEKLAGNLYFTSAGAPGYAARSEQIDELLRAIAESKITLITYQSQRSTEPVEYEIYPYALARHKSALYLVAHSRDHDALRTFKVDRMETIEVSGLPFQRPDDFDIRRYLSGSFGIYSGDGDIAVKLRFLPSAARYVSEGHWHASQQLARQKDGSLVASFRLSSTEEIKRWILSFGAACQVLEPDALRAEIEAEGLAIARMNAAPIQTTRDGKSAVHPSS